MSKKRNTLIGIAVALAGLGAYAYLGDSAQSPVVVQGVTSTAQTSSQSEEQEQLVLNDSVRIFTSQEYKEAYDALSLPNIKPIVEAPVITGNVQADKRIQALAEARGYRLRDVTSGILNELEGEPVQELLIEDWKALATQAEAEGISLQFVSGYRSVEEQTALFNERLGATQATPEEIAAGKQDSAVNAILSYTAPPGYSRHHSGYTIDVADPGFAVFADSTAYGWMSKNNYENAKKFGFIPSYPPDLANQGPEPEPWEFVWVGKQITFGFKD